MQAIAEEVVSTSGSGAKYITSGFSAYDGHSAIGMAYQYMNSIGQMYIGAGNIIRNVYGNSTWAMHGLAAVIGSNYASMETSMYVPLDGQGCEAHIFVF